PPLIQKPALRGRSHLSPTVKSGACVATSTDHRLGSISLAPAIQRVVTQRMKDNLSAVRHSMAHCDSALA
ncbi:MAG: hypothetical protein ABI128_15905, partial [Rhodanobacter sp.]